MIELSYFLKIPWLRIKDSNVIYTSNLSYYDRHVINTDQID